MKKRLTNWVLTWPFVKDAIRQAGIDAFRLAEKDVLETVNEEIEKSATAIAKERLEKMLTTVDESKIVTLDVRNKRVFIGGQLVDEGTLGNLHSEAEFLEASELWKILYETPKQLAQKALFTDDGDLDTQLLKGRAILYTLDTQKRIVQLFKELSTPKE